jgi:recombinational DNA repair protein (RecF pathway)
MALLETRGILINKTQLNDKSLIIRVLAENNQFISGIYRPIRKQKIGLAFLEVYQVKAFCKPGKDLYTIASLELDAEAFTDQIQLEVYPHYFLLAEITRSLFKSQLEEEGLFAFYLNKMSYFKGDLSVEFHIQFLFELIELFGCLPDFSASGKYFDLREARLADHVPSHADYVDSKNCIHASKLIGKLNCPPCLKNAQDRFEVLQILIRFLELQRGLSIPLKSIQVLKEIRD